MKTLQDLELRCRYVSLCRRALIDAVYSIACENSKEHPRRYELISGLAALFRDQPEIPVMAQDEAKAKYDRMESGQDGSFKQRLFALLKIADSQNLKKLAALYPEEVQAYLTMVDEPLNLGAWPKFEYE